MSKKSSGKILIRPRGNYDPLVQYPPLDLVKHNNYEWLSKKPVMGVEPSDANDEFWYKFAEDTSNKVEIRNVNTLPTVDIKPYPVLYAVPTRREGIRILYTYHEGSWIQYGGSGSDSEEITHAQYEALTDDEKNDGQVRYVSQAEASVQEPFMRIIKVNVLPTTDIEDFPAVYSLPSDQPGTRILKTHENGEWTQYGNMVTDSKDETVSFTSGDNLTPDELKNVELMESGETHTSLFQKISNMFSNIRYLANNKIDKTAISNLDTVNTVGEKVADAYQLNPNAEDINGVPTFAKQISILNSHLIVTMREQACINGSIPEGIEWDLDELIPLVRAGKFEEFAIGDYFIDSAINKKFAIAAKNHYPAWAFNSSTVRKNNIVAMPFESLGKYKFNNSDTNAGGYAGSLMPAQLETLYGTLSAKTRSYCVSTKVYENNKGSWQKKTSNMRLPTVMEVTGDRGCAVNEEFSNGISGQLPLCKSALFRILPIDSYRMLDPDSKNTTNFCYLHASGHSSSNAANLSMSVRPLIVLA